MLTAAEEDPSVGTDSEDKVLLTEIYTDDDDRVSEILKDEIPDDERSDDGSADEKLDAVAELERLPDTLP